MKRKEGQNEIKKIHSVGLYKDQKVQQRKRQIQHSISLLLFHRLDIERFSFGRI